ncbi:FtsX-like permease family protein [Pseudorhodoferax sp. Leaf267]|uniref:FtsX-like permease family protein n=1 Tax=Pseudorhodoferax sp. Leaf267 TaxID=1736316 RepID=UPI0006F5DED3|nr:ABC transporter permease [Pseudorhodoferax sp. Leaf267]KQP22535.1 ABC transporter permease [Pseudorhodoferax sp. Leaf267]
MTHQRTAEAAAPLRALLATFSWRELLHHPWRNAAAVVAVMLGVALAFSVQLINASALDEFASAVRSVNGQPDLELRAVQGDFDEALYGRVATQPQVTLASPVLELQTLAQRPGDAARTTLRVVGVDALLVARLAPALMPVPLPGQSDARDQLFAPGLVFLNPAAQQVLGLAGQLRVQQALEQRTVRIAGTVAAGGGPLAVMDLGAAQDLFGRGGQLTRIDLKLAPGTDQAALLAALDLPAAVRAQAPGEDAQRVSNLSRAYRVNLTVLALVALFTGAFLVFSVLSLSVARRAQQFALLGVLGLTGRERRQLVLWESLALGAVGSAAGLALGTALATAALRVMGGDLGGGYFAGVAPTLQWSGTAALVYGALGVAAALAGGWWPARAAQALPPAQTLKGLGASVATGRVRLASVALLAVGAGLALLPPVFGIPLGAYLSVALLLVGGITALPWLITGLYDRLAPRVAHRLLPLLAVERARRVRESAAVAVSGVVASLSLAVALTVMVASFRESMIAWLDVVLPAELYMRAASGGSGSSDTVFFTPETVAAVAGSPGVARVATTRQSSLQLDASRPAVQLLSRPVGDPATSLPLVGAALAVPAGMVGVYVSEPMVDLYGARPGAEMPALAQAFPQAAGTRFFVAGVWRDYVRQFGAVLVPQADFERLSGDRRVNDIAIWLTPGTEPGALQQGLRAQVEARAPGAGALLEFTSVGALRAISLRIFDRSFAVTYWLQAVAIGIGLFGVAASFSAQVLARRKEFGLLAHLGLTRRQILAVVAGEGAAWTVIGSIAGLLLGLAVSVVLVHVVNPQSFHWTMDLMLPWARLLALCGAVVTAGTLTAWVAGRAAAGRDAVLAVKEDW